MKTYKLSEKNRWWGYLHENGSIQAKRFFNERCQSSIDDAYESDFVQHVIEPFYAENRAYALRSIEIDCMAWLKTQK
jgi:hypothetical protein